MGRLCFFAGALAATHAWPGMKSTNASFQHPAVSVDSEARASPIGPSCTVGAHNSWGSPCPNTKQPAPPVPTPPLQDHVWASDFIVDWKMYFVPNQTDTPPYAPLPTSPYNVTRGTTYYHVVDAVQELFNMRETYESFCIPVLGDPTSPMGRVNNYSCDDQHGVCSAARRPTRGGSGVLYHWTTVSSAAAQLPPRDACEMER